jgi:hypothetical protein
MPNRARVGDRFTAGVVLHAKSPAFVGKVATVTVAIKTPSLLQVTDGGNGTDTVRVTIYRTSVDVPVRFNFTAALTTAGVATLEFVVRCDGMVRRSHVSVPTASLCARVCATVHARVGACVCARSRVFE